MLFFGACYHYELDSHLCYGMGQEHAWFSSSRFVELIDLLLGLKSPVDIASLRSRFASLHILMIHALKVKNYLFKVMINLFSFYNGGNCAVGP